MNDPVFLFALPERLLRPQAGDHAAHLGDNRFQRFADGKRNLVEGVRSHVQAPDDPAFVLDGDDGDGFQSFAFSCFIKRNPQRQMFSENRIARQDQLCIDRIRIKIGNLGDKIFCLKASMEDKVKPPDC